LTSPPAIESQSVFRFDSEVKMHCTDAAAVNVKHHLDNWGHLKKGPSHFETTMVLRIPASLATIWK